MGNVLTDPGIPAALTTAVVLLVVGVVGSLLAARRARRDRDRQRLLAREVWRREWFVEVAHGRGEFYLDADAPSWFNVEQERAS